MPVRSVRDIPGTGTAASTWKVSVLVTCFNHERYIRAALESVIEQKTSFPFEIVVCDDGSSDGTRAILLEF
ncbi:MAG TPA: glycosyltransferase, partial [Bryobacteraceae bacterium]|nr:glycosyltransferase [Bryobacteraceae bacterium]